MHELRKINFLDTLSEANLSLFRKPLQVIQVNVGKLCNQVCHHCHVDAGPRRKEIMKKKTFDRILKLLAKHKGIHTIDLTGGAPELNPHFRYFVKECRKLHMDVIDRCNLTVLFEKGQEDTAEFLREHRVKVIASLPCFTKENVDRQRGNGVFDKSIRALRLLNRLGFGRSESKLSLDLVYNPLGAFLPPDQHDLEKKYKKELKELFNIEFSRLFTITNMPIKRFLRDLERSGKLLEYMELLIQHFNPKAALGIMCRSLVSISWDGLLYDCDFNQMLEMDLNGQKRSIWQIDSFADIEKMPIAFANHCYGCTAGAGSGCSGTLL